jgi:hypothetical protein
MCLAATVHIGAGRVELTVAAEEKSRQLPFGGALNFTAGDASETIRCARPSFTRYAGAWKKRGTQHE